jgi:hypothetical protein
MKGHQITDAMNAIQYVLGGKSTFTLKSLRTGNHLTYEVYRHAQKKELHFVWARLGKKKKYLGTIFESREFRKTQNSSTLSGPHFNGFLWFWDKTLSTSAMPNNVEFYHHGHCCVCGRKLTTPESITKGIGPICDKEYY